MEFIVMKILTLNNLTNNYKNNIKNYLLKKNNVIII